MSRVVILKTHVWTDDLELFAQKIYSECAIASIDFFIMMHTDDGELLTQIKSTTIANITHVVTESEIKSIYPAGFYSMWLSNHWLLMYFYKKYGSKYDYFWSIEYDVRISGNGLKVWNCAEEFDFMFVMGNYRNKSNVYNNYYSGTKLLENDKYHGYLQLARYSNRALKYLDECFADGENGQDEMIIFSLMNRGKFTMSNTLLKKMVRGVWTWRKQYAPYNKELYDSYEKMTENNLFILHPVK